MGNQSSAISPEQSAGMRAFASGDQIAGAAAQLKAFSFRVGSKQTSLRRKQDDAFNADGESSTEATAASTLARLASKRRRASIGLVSAVGNPQPTWGDSMSSPQYTNKASAAPGDRLSHSSNGLAEPAPIARNTENGIANLVAGTQSPVWRDVENMNCDPNCQLTQENNSPQVAQIKRRLGTLISSHRWRYEVSLVHQLYYSSLIEEQVCRHIEILFHQTRGATMNPNLREAFEWYQSQVVCGSSEMTELARRLRVFATYNIYFCKIMGWDAMWVEVSSSTNGNQITKNYRYNSQASPPAFPRLPTPQVCQCHRCT